MVESKIIVALDYDDPKKALALVDQLNPAQCRLKVGKELFTRQGPDMIKALHAKGFEVFLDLKFHDIPNTVAKACIAAAELGVWMVNVHVQGGPTMLKTAQEALSGLGNKRPKLIGVTILTSMSDAEAKLLGFKQDIPELVLNYAQMAQQAGLDGVVCSAQEASLLRNALGDDFLLVTPGIRPAFAAKDDQARIVTPAEALRLGASYLVIGRPITQADNPMQALAAIEAECLEQ